MCEGRELLERLQIPDPWRQTVDASLQLIDDLERQIDQINRDLKASGAEHPYVPLLSDRARDRMGTRVHDRL